MSNRLRNASIQARGFAERRVKMSDFYEYEFVRIGQYRGSALFGVQDRARESYEQVVHEHARDGWRLVQIFAPSIAAFGAAKYYELIFERKKVRADPSFERGAREAPATVA
jgi:hypothetical protein